MNSNGRQYTVDNTERGIVSDRSTSQPMQSASIKCDIPAIRAMKDARTARIKSIGEGGQKIFSVGHAEPNASLGKGSPFNADWL